MQRANRRILCVAEKPSIARQVAGILAGAPGFATREGRNKYNKNFDFECMFEGSRTRMTMTSVLGHLNNHDFTDAYRKWGSCDPQALFQAPIVATMSEDSRKIASNLENEARDCAELLIWTDCDREGENIGFEVVAVCRKFNRDLPVRRAHFSSVSPPEVRRALQTLTPLDRGLSDAVDARSELDLRIGASFTRFQTVLLQRRFSQDLTDHVISYGPCQFPTLGFIVDRFFRVENHVPEKFWHIEVNTVKNELPVSFAWRRGRLFDEDIVSMIHEKCRDLPQATITSVVTKDVSKWRPLPLTTVELQKLGSTKLRMSSDKTMKIAEALYNRGLLSYPRTETDSFDAGFNHQPLVDLQRNHTEWGNYVGRLIQKGLNQPRKGKNNDQAHPPIHPTNLAQRNELTADEQKVYELVTRHYLACLSYDGKGKQTVVTLELAEEVFSASGLIIEERNYLEVYPYDVWSAHTMPAFQQGERIPLKASQIKLANGTTTAPAMLSEAELISLMDKNGIGTDATIHEHIKKVIEREYAYKDKQLFFPSSLGVALVEGYNQMGYQLNKPNLRAMMEADMKSIATGAKTKANVLANNVRMYQDVYREAVNQQETLVKTVSKRFNKDANAPIPAPPRPTPNGNGNGNGSDNDDDNDDDHKDNDAHNNNNNGGDGRNGGDNDDTQRGTKREREDKAMPQIVCTCGIEAAVRVQKKEGPKQGKTFYCCSKPKEEQCRFFQWEDDIGSVGGNQGGGVVPNCICGALAVRRVVKKEGPNKGPTDGGCKFFEWEDQQTATTTGEPRDPSPARPMETAYAAPAFAAGESDVLCRCNIPSVERTVNKDGANKGRKFFVCSKRQDDSSRCDFFLWMDAAASGGGGASGFSSSSNAGDKNNAIVCSCNMPAIERTVNKEGPNQGRKFYCCTKRQEEGRCEFFFWADGGSSGGGGSGAGGGRSSGFVSRGGGGYGNRDEAGGGGGGGGGVCFKCNKPGHFASKCPDGDGSSSSFGGGGSRGRGGRGGKGGASRAGKRGSSRSGRGRSRGGSGGGGGGYGSDEY